MAEPPSSANLIENAALIGDSPYLTLDMGCISRNGLRCRANPSKVGLDNRSNKRDRSDRKALCLGQRVNRHMLIRLNESSSAKLGMIHNEYKTVTSRRIVCGKFDRVISIARARSPELAGVVRIGSVRPKDRGRNALVPIATDGKHVLHEGAVVPVREFLASVASSTTSQFIVLTAREAQLIIEACVDFDEHVTVFESQFPIFRGIKYTSNLWANLKTLEKLLRKVRRIGINGPSIGSHISDANLYAVERKLRFKSRLDSLFGLANMSAYQEVFKLKEDRVDRKVIALDFNSMYADCMRGEFVEPKSLEYKVFDSATISSDQLRHGLYRVILSSPKPGFFRSYHPFVYKRLNKSFRFRIAEMDEIEVLVFKEELAAYEKHFRCVRVLEGIVSRKSITHPLCKHAESLYSCRRRYKYANENLMESVAKFELQVLHSCTNRARFKTVEFDSADSAADFVAKKYAIDFPEKLSAWRQLCLVEGKTFSSERSGSGCRVRAPAYESNDLVLSLSAQIVSNARIKMVETIEKFLKTESAEICYANTDSIHVSIKKNELERFLGDNETLIGNDLGQMKIEAIAERGYWFDVGRYWLIDDGEVVLFKNKLFKNKGSQNLFARSRKVLFVHRGGHFNYVKAKFLTIESSFSYEKRIASSSGLDSWDYERYKFSEVNDLDVAGDTVAKEVLRSKKRKIDLFDSVCYR